MRRSAPVAVLVLVLSSCLAPPLPPANAQEPSSIDFLCKPPWTVGDRATYFITRIYVGSRFNVIFEYLRTEELVWRGTLRNPEPLSDRGQRVQEEVNLVRRVELRPAPMSRYRGGYTNLGAAPDDRSAYLDVYSWDHRWMATILPEAIPADWSDLRIAKQVEWTWLWAPAWPLVPGHAYTAHQHLKPGQTGHFIDIRADTVDLGPPLGRIPTLLVVERFRMEFGMVSVRTWFSSRFPVPVKQESESPGFKRTLELVAFRRPAGPESAVNTEGFFSPLGPVCKPYLIVPGERVGRFQLGKPLDAYGFDPNPGHWEGVADGKPYYDGYAVTVRAEALNLWVFQCRSDNSVFAITPIRPVTQSEQTTEAMQYRTAQGIGIGTEESEVLRLMGRPKSTGEWVERHGATQVVVRGHVYPGLRIQVNRADSRVYAIGATTIGEFASCRQAVLGR